MITFFWFDLFIIPGIAQGIFIAIMLLRIDKRNAPANRILAGILIMAVIMLFGRLFWQRYPPDLPQQWSLLPDTTIFLFGPFIYFYAKTLLFDKAINLKAYAWHLVPALTHLLIWGYLMSFSKQEFDSLLSIGKVEMYYQLTELGGLLSGIIYWIAGFRLLDKYQRAIKDSLSTNQIQIKYIRTFHYALLICLSCWCLGYINQNWLHFEMYYINYNLVWTVIPLFIYLIGYYALKQPQLFRLPLEATVNKGTVNRLNSKEIEEIQLRLKGKIELEKLFTQNDLTLVTLANELYTTSNNLSWFLNEVHKQNFYDFINSCRTKEFAKKIEQKEHLKKTIWALALESGFNSKSTFNRAFREEMNCTPSDYIKNHLDPQFVMK